MSEAYAREILRRNVAQICQTIGWNGINSSPLDILVHVLEKYIRTLGTQASRHAEQFNRTEPNLNDLGLVLRDLNVHLPDLVDYTRSVPPVPLPFPIDKFPKPKESNLNFLKPGSHEVVTRPMHVHEHLPPMYPEKERDTPLVADTIEIHQNGLDNVESNNTCTSPEISVTDSPEKKDIFKRPVDPVPLHSTKRPRLRLDEEERTREISSVMMTMSGFLSPAREGKLPEARPPTIISEKQYDKHKANSHNSNISKVPLLDKSDKKSKKSKLLNGKIMKSKRKDKSHKGDGSKIKDNNRLNKHPPGHPIKNKNIHPTNHNHITKPATNVIPPLQTSVIPPPHTSVIPPPQTNVIPPPLVPIAQEPTKPIVKQEPIEPPLQVSKSLLPGEDAIPVPRKIPISKSPLVSNPLPSQKRPPSTNSLTQGVEIKQEIIDEEEKLASQPDRSKINIFKRISNKSKEDKNTPEFVGSQSEAMISRVLTAAVASNINETRAHENIRVKTEELVNNNNTTAMDLSMEPDLMANEVIDIDDDSIDIHPMPRNKSPYIEAHTSIPINKSLQVPFSKDVTSVSPKIKKERKHKEKKDKAAERVAKLEAKLLKKQQQQIAFGMAQAEKRKMNSAKHPKARNESKLPQMPHGFPFFPAMPPGRGLMPGPGLIPNPSLIPGGDFLTGLANNPALRGLPPTNYLTNPFALGAAPGLIPSSSFLTGGLGPGIPNPMLPMRNSSHVTSRSAPNKTPLLLRRPSLEVIPVDNDEDRNVYKLPLMGRDKDRHNKHKTPTIPNILQKQKSKSHKEHKSNMYKMPLIQPDITIELNPPKVEPVNQEPPRNVPPPTPSPVSEPTFKQPVPEMQPEINNEIPKPVSPAVSQSQDTDEKLDKKKDKSHKKEKKDKDGIKIKKKKDKKDKNKEKSERKKEEKIELKDKIKKEKRDKKKDKTGEGLVPKLTLKLNSSNSNSPMPPSSPDIFKLNIKPIIKKEEEEEDLLVKEEPVSHENSRSPELAQISALVTRPPKQKHLKQNHVAEAESQSSPPSSPPRKTPSSHSKYKRILFKPLSKKGHVENFDDDVTMISEEPGLPHPSPATAEKPSGTLPTPYYVDDQGNKIWVCPACGKPDNGSPMIGCDGCDCWYHWVCVGITEEPGASEDWFCKSCTAKRAAMVLAGVPQTTKKRGRKPKGEKVRDCH